MKVIHSWLKDYLGDALPTPEKVEELLTFHSFEIDGLQEVEGETVIDISVLPNRASDCLCHRGVARELASLLHTELIDDPFKKPLGEANGTGVKVSIDDVTVAPRFTAAVVKGVTVGPSPEWLQTRLKALGQRSINNVVDATNYVMYGIGQTTHAFDYDKLTKDADGDVHIAVRLGKDGERLTLLTGEEIISTTETLHLADGVSGTLLDLAGIKGGKAAELTDQTANIVVTSGSFNYQSVRKTARRCRVQTDAVQRFQNQLHPDVALYGMRDTIALILELAGGEYAGFVEVSDVQKVNPAVVVPVAQTNALLGLTLTSEQMEDILKRIGATVVTTTADSFTVIGPWERNDLTIAEDFIEEIGRIHGLHHIESIVPEKVPLMEVNVRQYYTEAIRQELIQHGFSEVITSSFTNKADIQLQNALAADKTYLRNSLRKNITSVLDVNFVHTDLIGVSDIRTFEIGTVFDKTETSVTEHVSVALGVRTKGNGYNPKDDVVLKTACDTVDQVLGITLNWKLEKGVAEVNLSTVLTSLPVPTSYGEFISKTPATYKPVSIYPAMSRDIALWVGEGEMAATVEATILQAAGDLCVRLSLFDTFNKDGRTSYAFRLVFQSFEKTLTDEAVTTYMDAVYKVVAEKGWEVR